MARNSLRCRTRRSLQIRF